MAGLTPSLEPLRERADRLVLELGTSPRLAAALAALHAGAAVVALTLPLGWPWRAMLLVFVGASLYLALWRHALRRAPAAVVALALGDGTRCALRRRGGEGWEEGTLVDCWVHARLALLAVRCPGRPFACGVVIPGDGVAAEPFRRLRVRLRLAASAD